MLPEMSFFCTENNLRCKYCFDFDYFSTVVRVGLYFIITVDIFLLFIILQWSSS